MNIQKGKMWLVCIWQTKQLTVDTIVAAFSVLLQKTRERRLKGSLGLTIQGDSVRCGGKQGCRSLRQVVREMSVAAQLLPPFHPAWDPDNGMVLPLSGWVLSLPLNISWKLADTPRQGCIPMVIVNAIKISHLRYYRMNYPPHLEIKFVNERGQTHEKT